MVLQTSTKSVAARGGNAGRTTRVVCAVALSLGMLIVVVRIVVDTVALHLPGVWLQRVGLSMHYLPLLAALAQAQPVEWPQGITTIDGSPPPQPLPGYCGTREGDKETKKLRHAPLACVGAFKHWYADGSDPSLRACAERCLACRESGGACRYVSFSFDRTGEIPCTLTILTLTLTDPNPNPNPHPP